ncbi:hypothetical protein NA57DRAFT_79053 [Rhizodiscina lignyota]|uniref:Uncharacterized protein n=1 Tax=Rhizodiscina lignyota TaxID=1504668 RepID=A0A9P4ID05_9PEZI|nr:hypothetical protein NA57DRAFT_79053 [Rhizodiscina lignyota]
MAAIVAVLRVEDKRPLTAWTFATSVNTVVSTLGTISRATLAFAISACIGQQKWNWLKRHPDRTVAFVRFDEASRGPWGSARLLFWLNIRHWASVGALVTIAFLAFDPFLQAIISYPGQLDPISDGGMPAIWRTDYLNIGKLQDVTADGGFGTAELGGPDGSSTEAHLFLTKADFNTVAAVNNGFSNMSESSIISPRFSCRTGNCTFSSYTSLAFCSSCHDVSGYIRTSHGNASTITEGTDFAQPDNIGGPAGPYTQYSLPYSHIKNYDGLSGTGVTDPGTISYTLITVGVTANYSQTVSFQKSDTMLIAFAVMRANEGYINNKTTWENSKPIATECALYFCVNAYDANIQDGKLNETVTGSWASRSPSSWKDYQSSDYASNVTDSSAVVNSLNTDSHEPLYSNDTMLPRTDLQLLIPDDHPTGLPRNLSGPFNITQATVQSTSSFLIQWSVGTAGTLLVNESPYGDNSPVPSVLDALQNSTNLTTTFANVAQSMTYQIRSSSSVPHNGISQLWVTHIRVQWTYLVLPAVALLGGCVYVILTLIETLHLKLPAWKESALATLSYGLSEETQDLLREADATGDIDAAAQGISIRLAEDGDGLRLQTVSNRP